MKKRLVAYLMVSALAVSVLAGCGGKGKGGDAGDAADAGTGEAAVIEEAGDAATEAAAAVDAAADKADYLTFEPGTQYTVVYGADVFETTDNTVPAIDELIPGYQLQINERLDDFWYNVSYIIDGVTRTGYIQIERTE